MYSEAVLQAIEANPLSSTRIISSEICLLQSSFVCQLQDFAKTIWSCLIVLHVTKIVPNFWFIRIFDFVFLYIVPSNVVYKTTCLRDPGQESTEEKTFEKVNGKKHFKWNQLCGRKLFLLHYYWKQCFH